MVKIDKDVLYARGDLEELLAPLGIDADFFVGRLKPRKVFRQCFLGADIIAAFEEAPALSHRKNKDGKGASLPPAQNRGNRTPHGIKRKPNRLDQLIANLKAEKAGST